MVWTGVAGMADVQAGTPVRPDMLFGVGSITKTFAAVVILQLVEEGRLDLHATAAVCWGRRLRAFRTRMVIEKVTGHEAVDEIHRRILAPLGLDDIHLEGFDPVPQDRLPHRYHWATPVFHQDAGVNAAFPEVRPGLIDASRSNLSVEWTGGGMVATARDLALSTVALRDGRLLKPESMKFMTEWFPAGSKVGTRRWQWSATWGRCTRPARAVAPPRRGRCRGRRIWWQNRSASSTWR